MGRPQPCNCRCATPTPNCFGCIGDVPASIAVDVPTSLLFTCPLTDTCLYSEAAVGVAYNSREYEYHFPDPEDEHGVQSLARQGSECRWRKVNSLLRRFHYATGNGTNLTPYGTACQTGMTEIAAPATIDDCGDHSICGTYACTGTGGTAFDKTANYTCFCFVQGYTWEITLATIASVLSWRLSLTVNGRSWVRRRSYARASIGDPWSHYRDQYDVNVGAIQTGAAEIQATCSGFPTQGSAIIVYTKAVDCDTDFTGSPVVLSYDSTETSAANGGSIDHPDMQLEIPTTISIDPS